MLGQNAATGAGTFRNQAIAMKWHPSNAAPEWQAMSLGWRSRDHVVACPLEGLVLRLKKLLEYIVYVF
jgi:hypothetical protein